MPLLDWKELDFIQVLSILPTEEDEVRYTFDVSKDGIRLVVTVWPYESVVGISLRVSSAPTAAIEFVAFVRGGATRQESPELEWIELRDAVLAPSRFSYLELGDLFDRKRFPGGFPICIYASPQIRIVFNREHGIR